jgi:hypothetical protein
MSSPEKPAQAPQGLTPLVTPLAPISQQVGENVLKALQTPNTVAVLSTIVAGVPTDRVVSMPLSNAQLAGVQAVLHGMQTAPEAAPDGDPTCIGFHCRLESSESS